MGMIVLKTVVTIGLILCLAWIAERASPRVAGILSGYPIGTALVLFFYGIQGGPEFAVDAIPYNLLGHVSALVFVYLYFLGARNSTVGSMFRASAYAITGYASAAWAMTWLTPSLLSGALISFSSIGIFSFLLRSIPDSTIENSAKQTLPMIIFRLIFSTTIVLVITGLAQSVGVKWAGLFSAFPLVVFPLLLLIHISYGADRAHTVLKNFPRGLWTVLAYSITISFTYTHFGVFIGTAVGYLAATAVLLAINWRIFFTKKTSIKILNRAKHPAQS